MSNYLFISSDTPSELLVPVTPVNHELEAISDRLIYVPLATRNTFGIIKVGEGLNINNGLLSFDRSELDVKLSTNVGSENAGKFLYVSDNGNIAFVDQIQTITKVSELENDVGYITNDTTSLVNYYDSLKVDQLFTDAITEAENAKAIAMGKSDSKVFDTYSDMIAWLGDENNKGQLIVGSNLFIKADGPDYWVTEVFDDIPTYIGPYPSYYSISPLESKLPDISNMATTDTNQVITANKTFTKYATFNDGLLTDNIMSLIQNNQTVRIISFNGKKIEVGSLVNVEDLELISNNRPKIVSTNNLQGEEIALVSDINKIVDEEIPNALSGYLSLNGGTIDGDLAAEKIYQNGLQVANKLDLDEKLDLPKGYGFAAGESDYIPLIGQREPDLWGKTTSIYPYIGIQNGNFYVKQSKTTNGKLYAKEIYQDEKQVANKEDVPTKTSQLENDSGFITADQVPEGSVLYNTTGQNTDGAMTQKAVSDLIGKVDVLSIIPSGTKQYLPWLRELRDGFQYLNYREDVYIDENGNLTDVRGTLASKNDIPTIPDLSDVAYLSDIPSKLSQLANDLDFVGNTELANAINNVLPTLGAYLEQAGHPSSHRSWYATWRFDIPTKSGHTLKIIGGTTEAQEGNKTVHFRIWNNSSVDVFQYDCMYFAGSGLRTSSSANAWQYTQISSKASGTICQVGTGSNWIAIGY